MSAPATFYHHNKAVVAWRMGLRKLGSDVAVQRQIDVATGKLAVTSLVTGVS